MSSTPITDFEPDAELLAVISECMENYEVGDAETEWPNNIISLQTIVYSSGVIGRCGAPCPHAVDPEELDLCRRLSVEAEGVMAGVSVGMGSNSDDKFRGFFIAGKLDDPAPAKITEELIRTRFNNTLFPPVTITAEPLTESGVWWAEVEEDGAESEPEYFIPWRNMIQLFKAREEFVDTSFVRIGDCSELFNVPEDELPTGTEITGCVLPRLALGLTSAGSLIGLFGYSVQT